MYERYLKQKELSHHGILGQKWGVRRFQNKDGSLTNLGKQHVRQQKMYKLEKTGKIFDTNREGTSALSYYDNALRPLGTGYNFNRSSNFQKDTPEYHRAVNEDIQDLKAARQALINRKKFYEEYGNNSLKDLSGKNSYQYTKHTQRTDGKPVWMAFDTATILDKPTERRISEDDISSFVKTTNPNYNDGYGWKNNCPSCSAVMTMKKMGYTEDLIASPLHDGASSTHGISQWFNGATTEEVGSINNLQSTISNYGIGSFGAIGGSRYATDSEGSSRRIGGHSMTYTVMDDGHIQIECGQSGRIYNSLTEAVQDQGFAMDRGFTCTRLDNTTPNLVNMAADGVLSTSNNNSRSSIKMINTENGKLVNDTDYYTYKHGGNHNFWG